MKKAENTFVGDYAPEKEEKPYLEQELASWHQSLIGMLRWMVKLNRVDITTKVSMMASRMAMPREEHL